MFRASATTSGMTQKEPPDGWGFSYFDLEAYLVSAAGAGAAGRIPLRLLTAFRLLVTILHEVVYLSSGIG
jgi:hypothetical protein